MKVSIRSRGFSRVVCLCALLAFASGAAAGELQYFRPAGSKAPYAAAVKAGDTVYVSGQLGAGADGKLPADFETQARNTMANVATALKSAGLGMDDVSHCTAMITDMSNWATFNSVYVAAFKPDHLPARSAMAVSALPMGALVEVDCKAYAGK
ncbi:RidA family protein [Pseudoxanthomonas composti]|uniref:RidA family protein n=1 Tax=Pseudoxanthomonas composti TaxID=2137479 RepID=A0A4V1N0T6_9GAMM|nr:RidA family protein [Pseudoxanthomonas composti]RXR02060.1 RidA family protein [Pseudoxanthomonas composti]